MPASVVCWHYLCKQFVQCQPDLDWNCYTLMVPCSIPESIFFFLKVNFGEKISRQHKSIRKYNFKIIENRNCFLLNSLFDLSCFFVTWFFQNQFFWKKLGIHVPSECQTVWIQIRPNILSGSKLFAKVIWQQKTPVGKELISNLPTSNRGNDLFKEFHHS